MKGKARPVSRNRLKLVSFPKLLAVLSLAIASRMSKVLICLSFNRELFFLTTMSPARRELGVS